MRGDFVRRADSVCGVISRVCVVEFDVNEESGMQLHAMCFAYSVDVTDARGAGRCGMLRR